MEKNGQVIGSGGRIDAARRRDLRFFKAVDLCCPALGGRFRLPDRRPEFQKPEGYLKFPTDRNRRGLI